jgi:hypothetical protein
VAITFARCPILGNQPISNNMKMRLLSLFLLVFISFGLFAQPDKYAEALMSTPTIAFTESQISFKEATRNAQSVKVVAEEGDYEKDLKNWLKTKMVVEIKKVSGFNSMLGCVMPAWSLDSLNFYFKTDKDGDHINLLFLIEQKGVYWNSTENADAIAKVRASIKEQMKDFYVKYYDKSIGDQQKYFDDQNKDVEKLKKQTQKVSDEMDSKKQSISKAEANAAEIKSTIAKSQSTLTTLNTTLEQNKKQVEQGQKEANANLSLLKAKEEEYNKLNTAGNLNTKGGQKVMKEIEKLKSVDSKLQARILKARSVQTKTENSILSAEQNKTKLESKLSDAKLTIDKYQSDISSLKNDKDKISSQISDKDSMVKKALEGLEKLKAAKAGIAAL